MGDQDFLKFELKLKLCILILIFKVYESLIIEKKNTIKLSARSVLFFYHHALHFLKLMNNDYILND